MTTFYNDLFTYSNMKTDITGKGFLTEKKNRWRITDVPKIDFVH